MEDEFQPVISFNGISRQGLPSNRLPAHIQIKGFANQYYPHLEIVVSGKILGYAHYLSETRWEVFVTEWHPDFVGETGEPVEYVGVYRSKSAALTRILHRALSLPNKFAA